MLSRPASPFKNLLSRTPSASSPDRARARSPSPSRSNARSPDRFSSPRPRWLGSGNAAAASSSVPSGSMSSSSRCVYGGVGSASAAVSYQDDDELREQGRRSPDAHLAPPGAPYSGPSSGQTTPSAVSSSVSSSSLTRAEHYDVVLERQEDAVILSHLGDVVVDCAGIESGASPCFSLSDGIGKSGSETSILPKSASPSPPSAMASAEKFESMLLELLTTERSYVQRMEVLVQRYTAPLRQMARDRDTTIIPLYEAHRLFGNVGEILGANTAFLHDLERFMANQTAGADLNQLGELVYRNMSCFSCYNEYLANYEKATQIEQTMMRTNKGFRDFIERTKYSTIGLGNVGLRELLMEPVQRIPRYTLLLQGLIKNIPSSEPTSRLRLEQALLLAGRIARCEVDDKTKRAAVLWSLTRHIDGFPASLISVHRQLIDCIDVDDFPLDVLGPSAMNSLLSPSAASSNAASYRTLYCSLLLFDDVIVIAKRASASSCGRTLLGLDNLNRLADQMKSFTDRSSAARSPSRNELGFRGLIDVSDVQVSDMGGPDFQLVMAKAPLQITGEKWASRFVRQYATIDSKSTKGSDPGAARQYKVHFLEKLWRAQALLKVREHTSHARFMVIPSHLDENKIRRIVYWSVYANRRAYLMEQHKALAALHVDADGSADQLPFGIDHTAPAIVVRIHRMDDEDGDCTLTVHIKDGPDSIDGDPQQSLLSDLGTTMRVASKEYKVETSDFGIQRGSPSTPSSSHRGKAFAYGLEQFGRSLFGTPSSIRSSAAGSDLFGVRRARSKVSSQYTRNASTSTRMTYSTTNTSSVGSRNMMTKSFAGGSPQGDGGIQASIERYRNASPTRGEMFRGSPDASSGQPASPSPVRRKPVPTLTNEDELHRRISTNSKRGLPPDETPSEKAAKRHAPNREREGSVEIHSPMYDGFTDRTIGPDSPERMSLTASPSRHHHTDADENTPIDASHQQTPSRAHKMIAPLSIRKDGGQSQNKAAASDDVKTLKMNSKVKSTKTGDAGNMRFLSGPLHADLVTMKEASEAGRDILHRLLEKVQERGRVELNSCLSQLNTALDAQGRLKGALEALLVAAEDSGASAVSTHVDAAEENKQIERLQTQVGVLTRKCELLTALEQDGRLENTEIHKAFNEELDRMYDDASLNEVEQVATLRNEVRNAKAKRNEASLANRALQKDLALERAQSEVWRSTLAKHGLL